MNDRSLFKCLPVGGIPQTQGRLKINTLYDVKTSIPLLVLTTSPKVQDVNMLNALIYEAGSFYIMDKGYIDFTRLFSLNCCKAYFITRVKENMQFRRIYSKLKVNRSIYENIQILSFSLLYKSPVKEILNKSDYINGKELNYKQIEIKLI